MLSLRDLNRTLLHRQHLLQRTSVPALDMVRHLVGLQAQESLPPYLSLAARIDGFDPLELSDAIESRDAVRLLTMRGTIHVLAADDALALRPWVQPALDQQSRSNQLSRPARDVPVPSLEAATRQLLANGPLSLQQLGVRLGQRFPGVPPQALANVARERVPLVQLPPRGLWRRSGGVVYQTAENHLGRQMTVLDVRDLVRRYLRAFGPATAADMTTWSRVTRLGPVFASMSDELVVVDCEDGRRRFDLPDGDHVAGDVPAPVRLLGAYDNLWLSHRERWHIVPGEARGRWMGSNGGVGNTVFVDGVMSGLWWWREDRVVLDLFRDLTGGERAELDEEVARIEELFQR